MVALHTERISWCEKFSFGKVILEFFPSVFLCVSRNGWEIAIDVAGCKRRV